MSSADRADRLRDLSRFPLVVAPMAGGPSTPALVIAVADAGALGFLAGGYKTATDMASEIARVRSATSGAFGVNLFVPGQATREPLALSAYVALLSEEVAGVAGLDAKVGTPSWDDDAYGSKLEVLLADPPPIVSFTFGCPSIDAVKALQAAGALVAITVTTLEEAVLAEQAGADCLCVQGAEAGAHRGSFTNDPGRAADYPLAALLAQVRESSDLPLIAAGGLGGPDDVAAVLVAGATQAQLGTAFLRCTESGAHPLYKAALADPRFSSTAITRAFSGRRARSLVNDFVRGHEGAPAAYPEVNNATRPLRAAAQAAGDVQRMSLYAGEGFRAAEQGPAAEIIERLASGVGRSVRP
jgi:nitronate monooxygenase